MPGAIGTTYGDLLGKLDVLHVECSKCGRFGRYPIGRLIEKRGRGGSLLTLWGKAPESAHETSNEYPVAWPELRDWWVAIIRKELERLGRVTAADREAAEATAVEEFALTDHQRKIQEVL